MIYTKNVKWCNACRWNFNIRWLKVDQTKKLLRRETFRIEEMLIRANHFTRVFKCQMNNFLKASIASDGWELSSHVREYGFRNPEYSLRNTKSHLRLKFRIRNPESQFHWLQRLESTTWNTESTLWYQESKNCLRSDSYPVASLYALWFMGKI